MLNTPVNGKIQGLFKAFECFSNAFQGKFNFQGLFKTVLYIQVLFKPVRILLKRRLHRLIGVYTCQNAILLEIMHGSNVKWKKDHLHQLLMKPNCQLTGPMFLFCDTTPGNVLNIHLQNNGFLVYNMSQGPLLCESSKFPKS